MATGIHSWSPQDWGAASERAAARHGLDPTIFRRQMSTESIGFRNDVIFGKMLSPAGAEGIAQIMPDTARAWHVNPLHPRQALDRAAEKMAGYVKAYGNYHDALVAYNAGPGRVGGSLPAETSNYIRQILHGHDPGRLGTPQPHVGGGGPGSGGGGAQTGAQAGQGSNLGSGSDIVATLASALQASRQGHGVGASAPALPAFAAGGAAGSLPAPSGGVPAGAQQSSLAQQLAAVAASVDTSAVTQQGATGGGGAAPAAGGVRGRTLYIGDSLGVGTEPNLKKLLGGHVDANVVSGRSSADGISALKAKIGSRGYRNLVLDLGTNDMTASQLAQSVQRARKLAPPGVQIFIPTLNGPFATKQKNALLHQLAAKDPRIQLVPWHSKSAGHLAGDGIHATAQGYESRAQLIAQAMGWQAPQGGGQRGQGQLKITGPNPGRIKPIVVSFAERVSSVLGQPLTGSDGSGHSRLTTSGNVSEHTTGNAIDIPLVGAQLIRAGRAALVAAGWSPARARKVNGGLFNVYETVGGKRVRHQIIFNTMEGGDHTNHLHISAAYR